MVRQPITDPRQDILSVAAQLFHRQGYDATSMNDIAVALQLSKGGLYHHFQGKEEILFEIMEHALNLTDERVLEVVRQTEGAERKLRTLIRLHVDMVAGGRDREITVMLHENHPLPAHLRRKINARKKEYVQFVAGVISDVRSTRKCQSALTPNAAAYALLGMLNWIYQWYRPDGALSPDNLALQYTEIFFNGALR